MGLSRTIRVVALAGLVGGALAACEPVTPRLQLEVTTTQGGADADPGDGICSSAEAGGACTLQAAVEEANAASEGADVTIPAGDYRRVPLTITGDVRLQPADGAQVAITSTTIDVADGARFAMSGINTAIDLEADPPDGPTYPPSFKIVLLAGLRVSGRAVVSGSMLGTLDVLAGGEVLLVDSLVEQVAATNHGSLLALRSTLLGSPFDGPANTALESSPGASSLLVGSVLAVRTVRSNLIWIYIPGGEGTCTGPAPTSGGYLHIEVPCGPMDGEGDSTGNARLETEVDFAILASGFPQIESVHRVLAGSPLIDAIPLGHPACPEGSVDVYGNPRGVDGDGDGVGGCDIGAVERQP